MNDVAEMNKGIKAEGSNDVLDLAYERLEQGKLDLGIRSLVLAMDKYDVPYATVRVTLDAAVTNGHLPEGFVVPPTVEDFRELYQ